jgi:outer membrane protein TolC
LRYLGAARLTAEGLPIALPLITERNRRDAELAVKVAQWEFDRAWRRVQERVDLADARAELAWEDVQGMVNVIESKQRGDPFPWNAADEDLPF